jgi:hypothetical protein
MYYVGSEVLTAVVDFQRITQRCTTEDRTLLTYSPPNIIRMIKSRRMRLVGYATRMGEARN